MRIAFAAPSLFAAAFVIAAPLPAQKPAPKIPSTPAGAVLRAWLSALSSGDSARIVGYMRRYHPDGDVSEQLQLRELTGGFDLVRIERSEPSRVEFLVKARKDSVLGYGGLALVEPARDVVRYLSLLRIGRDPQAPWLTIDAVGRARVVATAAALLDSFYVFPQVARQIGDTLRARLARGEYERYANVASYAMRLNDDLSALSHDKHMTVEYLPPAEAAGMSGPAPATNDIAAVIQQLLRSNCGFVEAKVLPGRVGYLKLDEFIVADLCSEIATAAMTFLGPTQALIIDLRENGGGQPLMVAYMESYLFDQRTHVSDIWARGAERADELWTLDSVPGHRYGGEKPVYVLTSSRTFSGAEAFAYQLQALKRATIVGETTGGGAHVTGPRRIDDHFQISVPYARPVNPITHTNWEGTGVEPDVRVPAAQALERAQAMIAGRAKPGTP